MPIETICENSCYLLALLNPASKVMFLASCTPNLTAHQNWELSWKSSLAALLILCILAATGQFVLSRIFRVELYSLQIAGGMVVFVIGWTAIREGRFVQRRQKEMQANFTDLSLVPLAAPLIAGPGMIAAVIAQSVEYGFPMTLAAMIVALLMNFLLMLFSNPINRFLEVTHLLGPLIRLTGLIIAAVALQMTIGGVKTCFHL